MLLHLQEALNHERREMNFPQLTSGSNNRGYWARLTFGNGDEMKVASQPTLMAAFESLDAGLAAKECA